MGSTASMKFGFVSPAQVDHERMFQLVRFQLAGFFYLMTFNEETELGKYWPGIYAPMGAVHRRDWGNTNIVSFSKTTASWDFKFGGGPTSNGYFQALIKRNGQHSVWSWAIEWNKQYRLYGFFGDEALIEQIDKTIEKNVFGPPIKDGDSVFRSRIEVPLQEGEDRFFVLDAKF